MVWSVLVADSARLHNFEGLGIDLDGLYTVTQFVFGREYETMGFFVILVDIYAVVHCRTFVFHFLD